MRVSVRVSVRVRARVRITVRLRGLGLPPQLGSVLEGARAARAVVARRQAAELEQAGEAVHLCPPAHELRVHWLHPLGLRQVSVRVRVTVRVRGRGRVRVRDRVRDRVSNPNQGVLLGCARPGITLKQRS